MRGCPQERWRTRRSAPTERRASLFLLMTCAYSSRGFVSGRSVVVVGRDEPPLPPTPLAPLFRGDKELQARIQWLSGVPLAPFSGGTRNSAVPLRRGIEPALSLSKGGLTQAGNWGTEACPERSKAKSKGLNLYKDDRIGDTRNAGRGGTAPMIE